MTFNEAVQEMAHGKHIWREAWEDKNKSLFAPAGIIYKKDCDGILQWWPTIRDCLANDWEAAE